MSDNLSLKSLLIHICSDIGEYFAKKEELAKILKNGTLVSENADYAEVGEWSDGNPNAEDRIGYFVSVDNSEPGKTMIKSTSASDVRGVTIAQPAFAVNASTDKYDAEGNLLPQYSYVCFAGFAPVIDNGTCEVNGRCMAADDGTAVPSINNMGYQVIERIDDSHVLILVEPQVDMMVRIKNEMQNVKSNPYPQCFHSVDEDKMYFNTSDKQYMHLLYPRDTLEPLVICTNEPLPIKTNNWGGWYLDAEGINQMESTTLRGEKDKSDNPYYYYDYALVDTYGWVNYYNTPYGDFMKSDEGVLKSDYFDDRSTLRLWNNTYMFQPEYTPTEAYILTDKYLYYIGCKYEGDSPGESWFVKVNNNNPPTFTTWYSYTELIYRRWDKNNPTRFTTINASTAIEGNILYVSTPGHVIANGVSYLNTLSNKFESTRFDSDGNVVIDIDGESKTVPTMEKVLEMINSAIGTNSTGE